LQSPASWIKTSGLIRKARTAVEASMGTKFKEVKYKLENGLAVLVFDDKTETTNIFLADDPILKKLNELPE